MEVVREGCDEGDLDLDRDRMGSPPFAIQACSLAPPLALEADVDRAEVPLQRTASILLLEEEDADTGPFCPLLMLLLALFLYRAVLALLLLGSAESALYAESILKRTPPPPPPSLPLEPLRLLDLVSHSAAAAAAVP